MIDNTTKEAIKQELTNYCANVGSDNKAAKALGISNAYISHIKAGKWEVISEDMWRKISKLLNMKLSEEWVHADTTQYVNISNMFYDAQKYANVYGITCEPGTCKTHTLDRYSKSCKNVFYVKCQRHTTDRVFLASILKTMGIRNAMVSSTGCLVQMTNQIERLDAPLIIIDEIEKVSNDVLLLFIDIYNACENKAGLIMLGTPNLSHRIEKGVANNKVGFNEILSRVGGKFVAVPPPSRKDATLVIRANGITDPVDINYILNDFGDGAETYDLRRIKRLVHKVKLSREAVNEPR